MIGLVVDDPHPELADLVFSSQDDLTEPLDLILMLLAGLLLPLLALGHLGQLQAQLVDLNFLLSKQLGVLLDLPR